MSPDNTFEKSYTTRMLLRDLARFLSPYKRRFLFASLARVCADVVWLYPAFIFAGIITFCATYQPGAPLAPLYVFGWLWLGFAVIRLSCQYVARRVGFSVVEQTVLDVKRVYFSHVLALPLAWHESENTGNKMKRLDRGCDGIDRIIRIWINNLIEIGVNLVGTVIILAFISPLLAFVTALFFVTFYTLSSRLSGWARVAAQEVNKAEEDLDGLVTEGIGNVRTAGVLNLKKSLSAHLGDLSQDVLAKVLKRISRFQLRTLVLGIYSNIFRITMFIAIAIGITRGIFALGFLLIFNNYFVKIIDAVTDLSDTSQDLLTSKLGIARMVEVLNVSAYPEGQGATVAFPKNWKTIEVKHLSFSYGGEDVLRDVSFTLHRGERLGLVGLSGAGKSTLFKLLLKENEDYRGDILIDGVSLKSIKKSSYYEHASVVLQDTEVFNFSLRENIMIANPAKAKRRGALERALDIAHVTTFLHRLPQGVETTIGEKGVKLSGGERQRLGIARAVFKEPELLFLDEATSHLDVESEASIQEALHEFFQSVTAIVIAHRLTTIKEMDRILVLEDGHIIEQGTFAALQIQQGRFHELWEKQKLD